MLACLLYACSLLNVDARFVSRAGAADEQLTGQETAGATADVTVRMGPVRNLRAARASDWAATAVPPAPSPSRSLSRAGSGAGSGSGAGAGGRL
jgi:hypothetical protein